MNTLYISDLDGTLLGSNTALSPFTLQAVNTLVERGVLFTYASARSHFSAKRVAPGLQLRLPVINNNGVFLTDPCTGERLSSVALSVQHVEKIRALMTLHGVYPLAYAFIGGTERVSWNKAGENEGLLHYLHNKAGDPRLRQAQTLDQLYTGELFYFTGIGERKDLLPVYDALQTDKTLTCTLQQELYRPEYWLEVMPRAASKANAALRLKALLGCDRLVCFGDAINDLSLFKVCDEAYAVANAVALLKETATGVIGSNDEDGVARWLMENAMPGEDTAYSR